MELRQLRYVEAVARHRHFTRAADELHVAQSALSHQIKRFEAEEAVAARARGVLSQVDGLHQEVDELRGLVRGELGVGATLPAGQIDVPSVLVRFSEAYSGIEVELQEGTAGDMMGYLLDGHIDVAFSLLANEPPPEVAVEQLGEEEIVAAFPAGEGPDRERVTAT